MRTVAANLQAMALTPNRAPYGKVVVDDQRIRSWIHLDGSTPASAYTVDSRLTNNNKIVRARNNNGTLEVHLATIGDTATFSSVTLTTPGTLTNYSGVALFNDTSDASPNRIDLYYVKSTNDFIRRITSSDNGTTWTAGANFEAFNDTNRASVVPQIAVAGWDGSPYGATYAPYLFYTTYPTGKSLGRNLIFYDGVNDAHHRCTLDDLGIIVQTDAPPVPMIGAARLNSTDFVCFLYVESPRMRADTGIYAIFYRDSVWSNIYPLAVFQNWRTGLDTDFKTINPTLCYINGTYWLIFVQSVTIGGLSTHNTKKVAHHLCAKRSTDLVHWTDIMVLAGTDMSADNGAFAHHDFVNAKMLVSGTRTFLVSYNQLYRTGTTSLLSSTDADYAAKTLDITRDVTKLDLEEPNTDSAQLRMTIANSNRTYNQSTILRRGSRVRVWAGYHTTTNTDANDLDLVFTGKFDSLRQDVQITKNEFSTVARQYADKLTRDYVSPIYWEYASGRQLYQAWFRDYGSIIQVQGQWIIQGVGFLTAQAPPAFAQPQIDIALVNTNVMEDCIFDVKFTIANSYTKVAFGPIFHFNSNADFLWLAFNNAGDMTWDLFQTSAPRKRNNNIKLKTLLGVNKVSGPAAVIPQLNQLWWCRVGLYQNKLVAYARADTTNRWTQILSYTTAGKIRTGGGYVGVGAVSSFSQVANSSNTEAAIGSLQTNGATGQYVGQLFGVPQIAGVQKAHMTGVGVKFTVKGNPTGNIKFYIVNDNGSGTSPMDISGGSGILGQTQLDIGSIESDVWTYAPLTPALIMGGNYWLVIQPSVTNESDTDDIAIEYNAASDTDVDAVKSDTGATWTAQQGVALLFTIGYAVSGGTASWSAFSLASGEPPISMDYIAKDIVTKAGVLSYRSNYFINDTFTSLSNFDTSGKRGTWSFSSNTLSGYNASDYGFLRCNVGTIHDGLFEFDMRLLRNDAKGCFFLRQQNANTLATSTNLVAYVFEFDPSANNLVNVYRTTTYNSVTQVTTTGLPTDSSSFLIFQAIPLIDIGKNHTYHIKIQQSQWFLLVYINDILVASIYDNEISLNPPGYVGFGCYGGDGTTAAVQFSNFVIPELHKVKDYFVFDAGKTADASLQDLFKDKRIYYWGDSNQQFRYGDFNALGSSAVSFGSLLKTTALLDDDTNWYSHIRAYGDYNADRFSGTMLDTDGVRFSIQDYTEVRTDAQAYRAAAYPLRRARETQKTYTFAGPFYPGLEREDRVTLTNEWDGVSSDFIVNSIRLRMVPKAGQLNSEIDARQFVAVDAETGAG